MRRISILVPILLVILLGSAARVRYEAVAHQGTPAAAPVGVTSVVRGSGQPEAAPGYDLALRRYVFEPGGSIPYHHHPGALVLSIESGALTYTVVEGNVAVQRAAQAGTPGPTEQLGPGDETVLNPGDSLFEQSVTHSARNDGDGQTVLWVSSVMQAGEQFTVIHQDGVTPTT